MAPVESMLLGTVKTPLTPTAGGRVGSGRVVVVVTEISAPPHMSDGDLGPAFHAGAASVVQILAALASDMGPDMGPIVGPIPSVVVNAAAPAMRASRRERLPANRIFDLQVE